MSDPNTEDTELAALLLKTAQKLAAAQKQLDADISDGVEQNFWDLLPDNHPVTEENEKEN